MSLNPEILDRNLRELLRRAYVPAPIRRAFREDLERRILEEVAARASRRRWGGLVPLLLAAAALAAVGVAIEFLGGGGSSSPLDSGAALAVPPLAGSPKAEETVKVETPRDPRRADPEKKVGPAPAGLAFTGSVREEANGAPVARFEVVALHVDAANPTARTELRFESKEGHFRLEVPEAGSYILFVIADGFASAQTKPLVLEKGAQLPPLTFSLERGSPVRGRVTELGTGRPIEGAVVVSESDAPTRVLPIRFSELPPFAAITRSGIDGRFELAALASGSQILRATKPGFAPAWSAPFELKRGEAAPESAFTLRPATSVRGRVFDAAGAPVLGATVIVMIDDPEHVRPCKSMGIASTDAEGRYEIGELPAGNIAIVLFTPAGLAQSVPTAIRGAILTWEGPTTVDFNASSLTRKLTGRIAGGAGWTISVVREGRPDPKAAPQFRATTIGDDERYEMSDLEPGRYLVFLTREFGAHLELLGRAEVPESADGLCDLALPSGKIEGKTLDATSGEPVIGAAVVLYAVDAPEGPEVFAGRAITDAKGEFSFEHVRAGRYRASTFASGSGYFTERSEGISVAGTPTRLDVRLTPKPR